MKFDFQEEKPKNKQEWIEYVGAYEGKCKPYLYYFWMNGCGWCEKFNPTWEILTKKYNQNIDMIKYEMNDFAAQSKLKKYNVTSSPTIILVKNNKPINFDYDERSLENFKDFFTKNNVKMD